MYVVLCGGANLRMSKWSRLIRAAAPVAGIRDEDILLIASNDWHKKSVSRQLWDAIENLGRDFRGALILSDSAWSALLLGLNKPVPMSYDRFRFIIDLPNNVKRVGIKIETPSMREGDIVGYLTWLKREADFIESRRSVSYRA